MCSFLGFVQAIDAVIVVELNYKDRVRKELGYALRAMGSFAPVARIRRLLGLPSSAEERYSNREVVHDSPAVLDPLSR
jgi:hypothetical protein